MILEELPWLAGLMEGEGSFICAVDRRTASQRRYLRTQVQMTDADVIAHASRVGGSLGFVKYGFRTPSMPDHHKDRNIWYTSNLDAYAIMVALWPWLGERRKDQIKTSIQFWLEQPLAKKGPVVGTVKRPDRSNQAKGSDGRFVKLVED